LCRVDTGGPSRSNAAGGWGTISYRKSRPDNESFVTDFTNLGNLKVRAMTVSSPENGGSLVCYRFLWIPESPDDREPK